MNIPCLRFLGGFRIFHICFIMSKMVKPHQLPRLNFWGRQDYRDRQDKQRTQGICSILLGSVILLGERSVYFLHSKRMQMTRAVPSQTTARECKFEYLRATVVSPNIGQVSFRLPLAICRWKEGRSLVLLWEPFLMFSGQNLPSFWWAVGRSRGKFV